MPSRELSPHEWEVIKTGRDLVLFRDNCTANPSLGQLQVVRVRPFHLPDGSIAKYEHAMIHRKHGTAHVTAYMTKFMALWSVAAITAGRTLPTMIRELEAPDQTPTADMLPKTRASHDHR